MTSEVLISVPSALWLSFLRPAKCVTATISAIRSLGTGATGQKSGTCGSYTQFPYYTPIYPGGDTEIITNFEYRVPIAGPVTLAAFLDAGSAFVWRTNQLQIDTSYSFPESVEYRVPVLHPADKT